MKTTIVQWFILLMLISGNTIAQKPKESESKKWNENNCTATFFDDSIHLINSSGKTAMLWLNNVNFKNGIVEVDIKGKDITGESFVGVAFHGIDNETYEAVYFRPFNFRDLEKKHRAVQYIAKPNYDWDMLREKYPGKFEHAIVPNIDPNNWFHVKLVILYPDIKVYVNGSNEPTLVIEKITERRDGRLGLWIDSKDGWFKNLTFTAENTN